MDDDRVLLELYRFISDIANEECNECCNIDCNHKKAKMMNEVLFRYLNHREWLKEHPELD